MLMPFAFCCAKRIELRTQCLIRLRAVKALRREGRVGVIDQQTAARSSWGILGARPADKTLKGETMHHPVNIREPVQILPGLTMRVQGREGIEVSYQADGQGGVMVRVDWRHAAEFWFEFHLDPRQAQELDGDSAIVAGIFKERKRVANLFEQEKK